MSTSSHLLVRDDLQVSAYRVCPPVPLSSEYQLVLKNCRWTIQRDDGLFLNRELEKFTEYKLAKTLSEAQSGPFFFPSIEGALAALNIHLMLNTGVKRLGSGADYDV